MQVRDDGVADALNDLAFSWPHWRKVASTNPIEHLNHDIRRRTRLVGIFQTSLPPYVSSPSYLQSRPMIGRRNGGICMRYMHADLLTPFYG